MRNYACINSAFFLCSIVDYVAFIVVLSGAQDILAGTNIQTSTILLADIGPFFLVDFLFPYFAKRIPYILRVVTGVLFCCTAFLVLGLIDDVRVKIMAVILSSFGVGVISTCSVGLMSYFNPSVLSFYSTGSGLANLAAPLYYTAMTTWLCLSPKTTLLILAPFPVVYLAAYYFIQREIPKTEQTRKYITYSKLNTPDAKNEVDITDQQKSQTSTREDVNLYKDNLTFKEKLSAAKKLYLLIGIPVFDAFVSRYIFFQSVVTTMAYPSSPFQPRDHYQYYFLTLMLGESLGRSNRSIIGVIKSTWLYTPKHLLLCVLAGLEVFHLMFFLLESWYRFLPGVGIPLLLSFTGGIVSGVIYSSSLELVGRSFQLKAESEFALSMCLAPSSFSGIIAAVVGFSIEVNLKNHCIATVPDQAYCFTRALSLEKSVAACRNKNSIFG